MSAMASQINSVSIVCLTVCSGAYQRKHQSSASLVFVREIHRWSMDSPHKGSVTLKMFPSVTSSWYLGMKVIRDSSGLKWTRERTSSCIFNWIMGNVTTIFNSDIQEFVWNVLIWYYGILTYWQDYTSTHPRCVTRNPIHINIKQSKSARRLFRTSLLLYRIATRLRTSFSRWNVQKKPGLIYTDASPGSAKMWTGAPITNMV